MSSPNTYTLLVDAVIASTEDDSTEFAAYLPTAINMAEDRLFRDLELNYSVVSNSLTCTASDQLIDKPTDLRVTNGIFVIVSGERIPLTKRGDEFCTDYWPDPTVTGVPKYFAERDIERWRVVPTPASNYSLEVHYEAQPDYLVSSTNETNVYTKRYPDLLFYATMVNMCEWMKDTERKTEWENRYSDAINSVDGESLRNSKEDNATKVGTR